MQKICSIEQMRQSKANQSFQKSEPRQNQMHSIRTHTPYFINHNISKASSSICVCQTSWSRTQSSASSSSKSIHFSQRPQLSRTVSPTRCDWRGQAREHEKRIVSCHSQPSHPFLCIANRRLPSPRRPDAEPVPQSRGHALPACC